MSDPFSVAGSAVGVISLGLQVCSKIVSYTQAVRGQNDDIQNLASKAANIRSSLKQLRELIEETRDNSPDFADDLEAQAFGLKANVEKLRTKIEQYKPVVTESLQNKARSTLKRVIYPLKKEALFEIGDCLDGMQATLRTALTISTARNIHRFELKQDSFDVKQDQLLEEMKTLQLALTNSSLQSVLQQPPSRVKQFCDQLSDQSWLGPLPPAQRKLHAKQVKKRYTYRSTWLGFLVTGTFSLSSGSGAFSIAPSLKVSAVVEDKSWSGTMFGSRFSPNGEPRVNVWRRIEYFIQQSQYAFSAGNAAPTDIAPLCFGFIFYRENFPAVCKFIKYMLSCGATLEYDSPLSLSRALCNAYLWTEEEFMFTRHIIEMEGPINRPPDSWTAKRNMQEILRRDEDCIDLPAAYIAVLRESYEDLRKIIKSKIGLPDNDIHGVSLLQSAMGWPAGVRLLLEEGSNTKLPIQYYCGFNGITDEDHEIDKYIDPCKILLEAGYTFSASDTFMTGSDKLKVVFLHELAKRRSSLLEIANARFHPSELSDIRKGETGLPDAQAYRICAALMRKGIDVGHSLRAVEGECLHVLTAPLDILKKAYELGFTDVTQRPPRGCTPLELYCSHGGKPEVIDWLISKGANPFERLPRSNTTVTHLLSSEMAIRLEIDLYYGRTKDITREAAAFRNFLQVLIEYNQSSSQACRSIIRSLTFDGLGLSHSCCTELGYLDPWLRAREECELFDIMEEQKEQAECLEGLVAEFESKFDAYGLPLMDFLQGVWYERMIRFISHRDPFDPGHHEEVGKLGVSLEMDDVEIPLVVQYICDQVRVVEDDSDSS
ncbi:hypothetical protein N7509_001288 [Penicillium cosmopolitanum]|uniref:Fungal N-terminal domain-containing protein n=1 Tax=Penicillium cosmopolitanum TaxID=1131564 RepID=A0A9X0BEV7_9EURO|nr:uncharacterized protein N7509_001288 [Penicillium cosmopolitanum]KAJ5414661.1 hypothetical protein N7509_001288 [Penicillium cosmopolitanum]